MSKNPNFFNKRLNEEDEKVFDDTYTYSDFKFKKPVQPQVKETKKKKAYDYQSNNIEQTTVFNPIKPKKTMPEVKKVSVKKETLTTDQVKLAEQARKARLDALMNKEQKVPSMKETKLTKTQIQEAIDNKNKVVSKDPKIISGQRKPLKPMYNQDLGDNQSGIKRVVNKKAQNTNQTPEHFAQDISKPKRESRAKKIKLDDEGKVKKARTNLFSNKSSNGGDKDKKKRRNKLIRRGLAIVTLILLLLVAALASYLLYIRNTASPLHLTVIGVDQREGQDDSEVRADAIMSINVGTRDNTIIIGSIPRDTLTYIPCQGINDKINHAYVFGAINWSDRGGGIACIVDSVQNLVDSPSTQKYAKVNFANMVGIVNAIGGIELTPTATFCEQDSQGRRGQHEYCFTQGERVHMNGEMALAYSRHRKSDDDIQRGLRQQEVVKEMARRAQHINILEWPAVFTRVAAMIETNLSFRELLQIALVYGTRGEIVDYKFNWHGTMINGISFVVLDQASLNEFSSKINNLQ